MTLISFHSTLFSINFYLYSHFRTVSEAFWWHSFSFVSSGLVSLMELVVGICKSTELSLLSLAFGLPKHIIFVTSPGLCSLFLVRLNSSVSVFVLSGWHISLSSSKVVSSLISRLEFPSFGQSSNLINVEPLKIQKRYNAQGLKPLTGAYKLFTTPNFSSNFIVSMYTYHIREDTCVITIS